MQSNNLPGPLLNAFVTLAHSGQFGLAAQRCNMSQPAFSQAIRRLEEQVGFRLFERNTRSVSLTAEGDLLLPAAEQVLDSWKSAVQNLRDHAEGRNGKVAIAALPSLAAHWLPKCLAEFRQAHPGMVTQLHDVVLERTLALVRENAVDFAVNAEVGVGDEFEVRPLFSDRFFLVCRKDHALASRRSVRLASLAGESYIHSIRSASMWRQLYPWLRGIPLRDAGFEVNYLSTLAGLIESGAGVSIVAGTGLFNFRHRGLATVPVQEPGLRYQVVSIRRRGRSLPVAARALEDLLAMRAVWLREWARAGEGVRSGVQAEGR